MSVYFLSIHWIAGRLNHLEFISGWNLRPTQIRCGISMLIFNHGKEKGDKSQGINGVVRMSDQSKRCEVQLLEIHVKISRLTNIQHLQQI